MAKEHEKGTGRSCQGPSAHCIYIGESNAHATSSQEVIELLSSFRAIMHKNFETMDVDTIQERWYENSSTFGKCQVYEYL